MKRYSKSKLNIVIILLLLIVTALSFNDTHSQYGEWQAQLSIHEEDITDDEIFEAMQGYSGIAYVSNLLLGSDSSMLLTLVFIIGFSALFGGDTFDELNKGFGNMIVSRRKYKVHLFKRLLAQAIYMIAFIYAFLAILTVVMMTIKPHDWSVAIPNAMTFELNERYMSNFAFIMLFGRQMLLIAAFVIPLVSLVAVTPLFVPNKYLNMAIPVALVVEVFILANTISNYSPVLAEITRVFSVDQYLSILYNFNQRIIQRDINGDSVAPIRDALIPVLTITSVCGTTAFLNIRRFGRDYLK